MNNRAENKVPVLLLTYRKKEFLGEILSAISVYNPSKLYVSVNNYKSLKEFFYVKGVKRVLKKTILPFEVEYIIHPKHLHINEVIPKSIDFVFMKEEKLIVLEDDIIPSSTFFSYCEALLGKYENDTKIGCINGCNLNAVDEQNTYFYSNISVPYWGWATWKNRWDKYRADNFYWKNNKKQISNMIGDENNRKFFTSCFDMNSTGINVWDVQWNLSLMANNFKTIIPGVCLTTNKGFVKNGVSTNYIESKFRNLKKEEISVDDIRKKHDESFVNSYEQLIILLIQEISNNLGEGDRQKFLSI